MGEQRMDRRAFLRRAGVVAGATVAGGALTRGVADALTGRPVSTVPVAGLPVASEAPVDHVVVLMMENRSFDHYFGWRTATSDQVYADRDGSPVATHHLAGDFRGCGHPDPDHSWNGGRAELAGGFLRGGNDTFALGYYKESDVELYAKLAGEFTLVDNYFCSLLGPTFPNREYMHSAQSGGLKTNVLPSQVPGYETGFTWPTIWDSLEAAGVPWAYYFVDLPAIGLWGARLAKGARHIEHFYADAAAGTLPNVVFVDPGFTTGYRTDEHPHGDVRAGQAFVHNIVKAVVTSPVWPRTAMFLNYDEWGGFFDHMTPPRTADVRATDDDPAGQDDFGQLGFRVPCLMMSPYARAGALSSALSAEGRFYDHTSILKLVEWRFGLAPLTARDAAAANIGELLDFDQTPRLDAARILELLPRIPITSQACEGDTLSGIPGAPRVPVAAFDDDFQRALESGWFERVGYRIEPRPLKYALGG